MARYEDEELTKIPPETDEEAAEDADEAAEEKRELDEERAVEEREAAAEQAAGHVAGEAEPVKPIEKIETVVRALVRAVRHLSVGSGRPLAVESELAQAQAGLGEE